MKRSFSLLLTLVIVIGIFTSVPVTVGAASVDDLTFKLNEDGESYSVTACNTSASGEIVIPEIYEGLEVTNIGKSAFEKCTKLTSIIIPNSVMTIDWYAFSNCDSLSNIVLPENLTTIEGGTFYSCDSLKKIVLPNNVTSIKIEAFLGCKNLSEIIWSSNLLSIGCRSFQACHSLVDVVIPNTVTEVWNDAFSHCKALESIIFSNKITYLGERILAQCSALKYITIPESVTSISGILLYGCKSENITIKGYGGSYAEEFANEYNYKFLSIGEAENPIDSVHTLTDWIIDLNPTCTDKGMKHSICSVCGMVVSDEIIAKGHNFSTEWTVDIVPTCVNVGSKSHHCLVCDERTNISTIDKINHTIVIDNGIDATCTKTGLTEGSHCSVCGIVLVEQDVVTEKGHIIVIDNSVGATCTKTGLTEGSHCSVCREVLVKQDVIEPLGHNYPTDWTIDVAPTCTEEGSKSHHCTVCDSKSDITSIPVAPNNHIFENGVCTECGYWRNKSQQVKLDSISNTVNGVNLKWRSLEGADDYIVYRKTYNSKAQKWSGWSKIKSDVTGTSYIDTTAKSGVYYCYTVRAENESELSDFENYGLKIKFLSAPKVSSAVKNTTGVAVKWNKISGAKGYYVYRKDNDGAWSNIGTIKSGSTVTFTDKNTKTGVKYTYTVRAYNGNYSSSYYSGKTYIRLATPSLSSVSNGYGNVTVKWSKITGASGYYIYRKAGSAKSWSKIATIKSGSTTSYADKTVKSGTNYTYTVKAYYGSVLSGYNKTGKSVKYIVAPKISSVSNAISGATIKWNKIGGVDGYYLYRKADSATSWSKIATFKRNTKTSYTDKNVKSGTKYTYTVRAYDGKVISGYNKTGTTTIFLSMPIPKVVTVDNGVKISWNKIGGATNYYIYRSQYKNGTWSSWDKLGTVKSTLLTWVDSTGQDKAIYKYTVRAVNGNSKSTYTASDKVTYIHVHENEKGVCKHCGALISASEVLAWHIIDNGVTLNDSNIWILEDTDYYESDGMIGRIEFNADTMKFTFALETENSNDLYLLSFMELDYGNNIQNVYHSETYQGTVTAVANGCIYLNTFSINNPYVYSYEYSGITQDLYYDTKSLMQQHLGCMFVVTEHMLQKAGLTWQMFGANPLNI